MTEHQQMMLEMLKEIDRICRKHKIPYQLYAGTALGAVRHQGFIPWDDDVDVIMLRKDYEQLLRIAEQELDQETYTLQKEFSRNWPMFFSKLRRNGTTCYERYVPNDPAMHQGVYVDIFPCDSLSERKIVQWLQFAASKIIIAKSLDQRGYITDDWKKKWFILLCRLMPKKLFYGFAIRKNQMSSEMVHGFFAGASAFKKSVFPRKWLEESILLPFEGELFPVSKEYDKLLIRLYGDYQTPLLPEQREMKIHGVLVDLERPYEDYAEQQKTMKFSGYSRSIR